MQIQEIKKQLIKSCVDNTPEDFLPYLNSENVKTNTPKKEDFYSFYCHMLKCGKENSFGKWTLCIENVSWSDKPDTLVYNFYDEKYKHARLNILVTEKDKTLLLEVMPF